MQKERDYASGGEILIFSKEELLQNQVFMTDESFIKGNVATSTLTIAHIFGKRHKNILQIYDKFCESSLRYNSASFSNWRVGKDVNKEEEIRPLLFDDVVNPLETEGFNGLRSKFIKNSEKSNQLRYKSVKNSEKLIQNQRQYKNFLEKPKVLFALNSDSYNSMPRVYRYEEAFYVDAKGEKRRVVLLNDMLTMYICMGFTGEKVERLKHNILVTFQMTLKELRETQKSRVDGRQERIKFETIVEQNVKNEDCSYNKMAYITNLIYKAVFDKTAKELRIFLNCPEGSLRDQFSEEDLSKISELEKMTAGFLMVLKPIEAVEKAWIFINM